VRAGASVALWAAIASAFLPSCLSAAPSHVSIAPDGGVRVDGQPFLPVGVEGIEAAWGTNEVLQRLADAGLDTVHWAPAADTAADPAALAQSLVRRCRQHGLWAVVSLAPPSDVMDLEADEEGLPAEDRRARLTTIVKACKDEPNLLAYAACPEALWNGYSPAGMAAGYQYVHGLDPDHLVWVSHAPRGSQESPAEHALIGGYLSSCDATGVSLFPVPDEVMDSNLAGPDGWPIGGPPGVGAYAHLLRRITESGERPRSLWMGLQGCSWSDISPQLTDMRYPTREELRFMALDAIGAGANGVFFHGVGRVGPEAPFWADLLGAAGDLRPLLEALASPRPAQQPTTDPSTVSAFCAAAGPRRFVVVLNRTGDPAQATVRLPGGFGAPKGVLGPAPTKAEGGSVTLELPPYGSAVLEGAGG